MVSVGELQKDLAELISLESQAVRQRTKDCLKLEQGRITAQIAKVEAETKTRVAGVGATAQPTVTTVPARITKDLTNYAWDQSDKFMKIYLTLDGVHNIPKDNITCEFNRRSCHLKVGNLNNNNYSLHVRPLHEDILSEGSHFKVKTDAVTIFMKKETAGKTWPYIKEKETKKPAPKVEDNKDKDPQDGLMDMMKKMYDEGDDEMKRTIAKAWSESQSGKRSSPMDASPMDEL